MQLVKKAMNKIRIVNMAFGGIVFGFFLSLSAWLTFYGLDLIKNYFLGYYSISSDRPSNRLTIERPEDLVILSSEINASHDRLEVELSVVNQGNRIYTGSAYALLIYYNDMLISACDDNHRGSVPPNHEFTFSVRCENVTSEIANEITVKASVVSASYAWN